jgi:two-component sensor histidine kinase
MRVFDALRASSGRAALLACITTAYFTSGWIAHAWPHIGSMWREVLPVGASQFVQCWLVLAAINSSKAALAARRGRALLHFATGLTLLCSALGITLHLVIAVWADAPWEANVVPFAVWNVVFCGMIVMASVYEIRQTDLRQSLHDAQVARLGLDRDLDKARLGLLQAQVEPHFIFNALANVRWLLRVDRQGAQQMLDNLIQYFAQALPHLRREETTLAAEFALIRAYLAIQQVRMGERLRFRLDLPQDLAAVRLPPVLLLTLVENALKHGLQPRVRGGEIAIIARRTTPTSLTVSVLDDGVGMSATSGTGTGLANVQARLRGAFADTARLVLMQRDEGGVEASLVLPMREAAAL